MYRQSEKNLLNSNMVNFGPLTAEIGLGVCGTPTDFNGFHVLLSLQRRCRSPEANQSLHDVWLSPGLVHYIYIYIHFGALAPWHNFAWCRIHFTSKSCVLLYFVSVTARHSSSGCQPNFAAWYKEWNYGTLAEGATYIWLGGHHVGHRHIF